VLSAIEPTVIFKKHALENCDIISLSPQGLAGDICYVPQLLTPPKTM